MTEEMKKRIATFRFGVISDIVTSSKLDYGEQERLVQEKCNRQWDIPYSPRTHIARSTIYSWLKKYTDSGNQLTALYPRGRSDIGVSRTIDDEAANCIIQTKLETPALTLKDLINKVVKDNPGLTHKALPKTNVYRILQKQNLTGTKKTKPKDRRRFEAENPNDIWQSDVMHGPSVLYNNKLKKTYLLAIIDDHTRIIPNARFYFSENLVTYLTFLEEAFQMRGLPIKLYVDNGAAFKSHHLKYVTACLEITLINAKAYQPEGKGKIERWFKTVRSSFLPTFTGNSIEELNNALTQWINKKYHQTIHSSTGEKPVNRFASNMECIRVAPKNLTDYFRKSVRRTVAKDRTVTINGLIFEAPVALIGQRVELLYHEGAPETVEVRFESTSYGFIEQVDIHVNCRVKRNKDRRNDIDIDSNGVKCSSGELFYEGADHA
jgi:transposase InsO family protein